MTTKLEEYAVAFLRTEISRLQAELESIQGAPEGSVRTSTRRGRKALTPEQRALQGAKMREYWALRRKAKAEAPEISTAPPAQDVPEALPQTPAKHASRKRRKES